jgi:SAM-dependent methyltransferase
MSPTINFRAHPAAEIFPFGTDRELRELAADIKEHGQREPIVLYRNKVLDGRRRQAALRLLNDPLLVPKYELWDEKGSIWSFVISKNFHRRHLSPSQRAMIAAKAKKVLAAEAKSAQRSRGKGIPVAPLGKSRDRAAEDFNVSPRSIDKGSLVLAQGTPELIRHVEAGQVAITSAAIIAAKLTKHEQKELLAGLDPELVREKAKEIKKAERAERLPEDQYYTPFPLARAITIRVRELLENWNEFNPSLHSPRRILEPSSGGGAFLGSIREQWPKAHVTAVDIRKTCQPKDRSIEWHHSDFLDFEPSEPFDLILTNPPYVLADAFRGHALKLLKPGGMVAFLLGVNFLDGQERAKTVWSDTSGAYLAPIAPRPDFTGDGGAGTGYALFAWVKDIEEQGELDRAIVWERDP